MQRSFLDSELIQFLQTIFDSCVCTCEGHWYQQREVGEGGWWW